MLRDSHFYKPIDPKQAREIRIQRLNTIDPKYVAQGDLGTPELMNDILEASVPETKTNAKYHQACIKTALELFVEGYGPDDE